MPTGCVRYQHGLRPRGGDGDSRSSGREHPNGRRASRGQSELQKDSTCAPTFHHSQQSPETATRQLDFVFASKSLAPRIATQALNKPDEWGPSDHCRVQIDIDV